MILYDYVLSGNCYKIRLLLNFLGIAYEKRAVDFFPGAEHRTAEFREINPLGQIPVLEDEGERIRDAQAILIYIAARYDENGQWWPVADPIRIGQVAQWLATAEQISATSSAARLHDMLHYDLDVETARLGAHRVFRMMEDHLSEQEFIGCNWLAGPTPTIADIACFPYTALAGDGGIELFLYPALQRWISKFTRLPNFIEMPGIKAAT